MGNERKKVGGAKSECVEVGNTLYGGMGEGECVRVTPVPALS